MVAGFLSVQGHSGLFATVLDPQMKKHGFTLALPSVVTTTHMYRVSM